MPVIRDMGSIQCNSRTRTRTPTRTRGDRLETIEMVLMARINNLILDDYEYAYRFTEYGWYIEVKMMPLWIWILERHYSRNSPIYNLAIFAIHLKPLGAINPPIPIFGTDGINFGSNG